VVNVADDGAGDAPAMAPDPVGDPREISNGCGTSKVLDPTRSGAAPVPVASESGL